jgi:hypothetical protein
MDFVSGLMGAGSGMGGGGYSSSATSSTGAVSLGGFNFQPKGSNSQLPPVAWIALAVVAAVLLLR